MQLLLAHSRTNHHVLRHMGWQSWLQQWVRPSCISDLQMERCQLKTLQTEAFRGGRVRFETSNLNSLHFFSFSVYFMVYKQVKTGWSWLNSSSHLARQVYRRKSIPWLCSLFTLAQTLATNGNAILLWQSHCSIMLFWFHLSTAVGILSSFMFLLLTERLSFMRSLSMLGTIKAISRRISTRWQQMGV